MASIFRRIDLELEALNLVQTAATQQADDIADDFFEPAAPPAGGQAPRSMQQFRSRRVK